MGLSGDSSFLIHMEKMVSWRVWREGINHIFLPLLNERNES